MSVILNSQQIEQRINRIAYQIYEDNFEEKEIIFAGIVRSGYILAQRVQQAFDKICSIKTHLIELHIDKNLQAQQDVHLALPASDLKDHVVILVDDVLNSGKTLTYALRPFLNADVRKIRTVLLVDRDHKRYPVFADYTGLRLSTTLREHVTVDLTPGSECVTLT